MIISALAWLWFRFEFIIDWGKGANLNVDLIPAITLTIGNRDSMGYRPYALSLHFLIFSVVFNYYYSGVYRYDHEGNISGTLLLPECSIIQI